MEMPVDITERALTEVRHILESKKVPEGYGLRIGAKGGGCGGAVPFLGFDTPKEKDEIYRIGGLEVYVDKRHVLYLFGLRLDFEERATERGFVFNKV